MKKPAAAPGEVEAYLGHLLTERGLSRNTVDAYRRDLGRLHDFLDGRGISPGGLTYPLFSAFIIKLREELAPVSVARLQAAVNGYLDFLLREGSIAAHPLPDLESPRPEKNLPRVLKAEEVEMLLDASGKGHAGARDRAILELLYATGMRVSELVGLRPADVDRSQGLARVRGKGGRERLVPFGRPADRALEAWLAVRPAGPGVAPALFLSRLKKPLSRQSVWKIIRRAAAAAGLQVPVYPHILRHSCATHFLEGGAGIRAVQEVLGHRSLATTQVYTHLEQRRLREIHRRYHPRP